MLDWLMSLLFGPTECPMGKECPDNCKARDCEDYSNCKYIAELTDEDRAKYADNDDDDEILF